MKPYKCSTCGETKPDKFNHNMKGKCRSCQNKERVITQRLNPEYQKKQAKYYKQWYAKYGRKRAGNYGQVIFLWRKNHRDEVNISQRVRTAIKNGQLERPLVCAFCGKVGRINAHHDDYNLPFDITWVCSSCHKKLHLQEVA